MQSVGSLRVSPWSIHAPVAELDRRPAAPTWTPPVPPPLSTAAPAAPEIVPPDWIQDIRRKYILRITDWATQTWAITRSPGTVVTEWIEGKRELLAPLRFFAFGATITYLVERAGRWLLHIPVAGKSGWSSIFETTIGRTVGMAGFLAIGHFILRVRSRAYFRSSLAASLYVVGGPKALIIISAWMVSILMNLVLGHVGLETSGDRTVPLPVHYLEDLSIFWSVAAYAAVHRTRWWWAGLALIASVLVSAVVIGFGAYAGDALHLWTLPIPHKAG